MVVVNLLLHRGHCNLFSHTIPPLQAAPSFACSVASLSRFPDHQLPGCSHLRERILADYLLGWGAASARRAGHAQRQTTPSPESERHKGEPPRDRSQSPRSRALCLISRCPHLVRVWVYLCVCVCVRVGVRVLCGGLAGKTSTCSSQTPVGGTDMPDGTKCACPTPPR